MKDAIELSAGRMERRQAAARDREAGMAETRALGNVPEGCGPEIPDAPARGPVVRFMPKTMYPDGEKGFVAKEAGYQGRKALRHADVFDRMASGAAKNGKANPFTPAQIAMGRFYRDLDEKHQSAGLRCSSLEAMSGGSSGGGGEYMDAVLRDRERLAVLRSRIGDGSAMVVRRQRPSTRGSRQGITDRRLVDMVCIEEKAMTEVLVAHGWAKKGTSVKVLVEALCAALERMAGPIKPLRSSVVHYGDAVPRPFT